MKLSEKDIKQIERVGILLFGISVGLMGEHIVTTGGLDIYDPLGHDWVGLALFVISMILLVIEGAYKGRKKKEDAS